MRNSLLSVIAGLIFLSCNSSEFLSNPPKSFKVDLKNNAYYFLTPEDTVYLLGKPFVLNSFGAGGSGSSCFLLKDINEGYCTRVNESQEYQWLDSDSVLYGRVVEHSGRGGIGLEVQIPSTPCSWKTIFER